MLDPNEAVNITEPAAVEEVAQQPESTEGQVATGETVQQEQDPVQGQAPQYEAVDEQGVPFKNRYMEAQRKLAELSERQQRMEETLAKQQAPQERKLTIQELEQYALQNPSLRPEVEAEKFNRQQEQLLKAMEERDHRIASQARYESEIREYTNTVLNDPKNKDFIVTNAMGQKIFNQNHPITQSVAQYLQDPRLKGQPDAIVIAAKLARTDYADQIATKATTQAKVLQANLKREQKKTMVEGGSAVGRGGGDDLSKAKEELSRTGTSKAAQSAIGALLKKQGILR
jgi:hypothetical protein